MSPTAPAAPAQSFPVIANVYTSQVLQARLHDNGSGSAAMPDDICLQIPSWAALRERFERLKPRHRHVGADDVTHPWLSAHALDITEAILARGRCDEARRALQRGAPPSCRARLWEAALALGDGAERCDRLSAVFESHTSLQIHLRVSLVACAFA